MYPILFEFGPVTVFSLWFFVALGFTVGALVSVKLARRYRIQFLLVTEHGFFLFLSALIVSRFTFITLHPDFFFYQFSLTKLFHFITVWDKGLSFWGALIGFALGLWHLGRADNQSLTRLADVLIPGILLGLSIGDIGAFLDGINYGTPTSLPWGVIFESANVKYITPIHPTQLYSMLYTLGLGIGLILFFRSVHAKIPGTIALAGCLAYSTLRFLEDFLRGDETTRIFSMRLSQILALGGMLFFGYLLFKINSNKIAAVFAKK